MGELYNTVREWAGEPRVGQAKPTFSYLSEDDPVFSEGCASFAPSVPKDSFVTSARGLEPPFLGAGPFFAFFGGVLESKESSSNLSLSSFDPSSLSGFDRFLEAVVLLVFKVVCVNFLGAALVAAGFFGFAFDFCVDTIVSR